MRATNLSHPGFLVLLRVDEKYEKWILDTRWMDLYDNTDSRNYVICFNFFWFSNVVSKLSKYLSATLTDFVL